VVVHLKGRVIGETRNALILQEASYPPVFYVRRLDADMALFVRSDHASYCPCKGDCSYFNLLLGGSRSWNAAWSYEAPYPAVAATKHYLTFYPDRVDAVEAQRS
jgi:uncharacterized protein (DUF427 family)